MAMTVRSAAPLDGAGVLSLQACKDHLRVTGNDEDTLISSLRNAALDWVERYTSKALVQRQFVVTFDRFASPLRLPVGPVSAVASIGYLDAAGAAQAVPTGVWRRADDVLVPVGGQAWPVASCGAGAVTVTLTAGYAVADVPPSLLVAARMLLTHLFINRSAVQTALTVTEAPLGVIALCDMYRMPVLA